MHRIYSRIPFLTRLSTEPVKGTSLVEDWLDGRADGRVGHSSTGAAKAITVEFRTRPDTPCQGNDARANGTDAERLWRQG